MINKLAAASGWLILAAIAFSTLSPISLRPQTGHVLLERFGAFCLLGACFGLGYPRRMPFAALVTLLAAGGLEAAQLLAPGRHARVVDALEKLSGGVAGLVLAGILLHLIEKSGRHSDRFEG